MFKVSVKPGGTALAIQSVVPWLLADRRRLMAAHDNASGSFNKNTHKATSFKNQVDKPIAEKYNPDKLDKPLPIFGAEQVVSLPYRCFEEEFEWELQLYEEEDSEVIDEFGGTMQYRLILAVDLKKYTTAEKKKKKAGFRLIGSPLRNDQDEDDDLNQDNYEDDADM